MRVNEEALFLESALDEIDKNYKIICPARWVILPFLLMILTGCVAPIKKAARDGDMLTLRRLVDSGVDPNEGAPLAYAVVYGHKEPAIYLLDKGADPNGFSWGYSILFHAMFHNKWDIARILVERGADAESAAAEYEAYGMTFGDEKKFLSCKARADRVRRMAGIRTDSAPATVPTPEKSASAAKPDPIQPKHRSKEVVDKINLAILDLDAVSISTEESVVLTNRLRSEVFSTNRFVLVERNEMNEILKEQGFQLTGCTSSECLVEAGQLLNVNQMIGGSIGKIGNTYTIEIRLIDISTGKILAMAAEDIQGRIDDVLKTGIPNAVIKLIK